MNMNTDPSTMEKILADLAKEQDDNASPIDKALESADGIRKSIELVHGTDALKAVDFINSMRKVIQILAFYEKGVEVKDPALMILRVIVTRILAGMASQYYEALGLDKEAFAPETMTDWADRLEVAEQKGLRQMLEERGQQ